MQTGIDKIEKANILIQAATGFGNSSMQKMHDDLIKEEFVVENYLKQHYCELTSIKFPFLENNEKEYAEASSLTSLKNIRGIT